MGDSKEFVINLRVSKQTYEKIKNRAKKNKDSVSNLIRNIINDSTEIISDISSDLKNKEKKAKFNDVLIYQRGTLAKENLCGNCGAHMAAGESVTIGRTDSDACYYFCFRCK